MKIKLLLILFSALAASQSTADPLNEGRVKSNGQAGTSEVQKPRITVLESNHASGAVKARLPVISGATLHGAAQKFYETGLLKEVSHWSLGVREGMLRKYSLLGILSYEVAYRKGLKHGREAIYDESGRLRLERQYLHGRRWGNELLFYPSGKLKRLSRYRQGKKHGQMEEYRENGKLLVKAAYRRGVFHGIKTVFDLNGDAEHTVDYFDGVAISREQLSSQK